MTADRRRVLFLCTHNSARSQMAEGLLRSMASGQIEVVSAGSEPGGVHPLAVAVMQEVGIHIASARSKSLDEFAGQRFDYVITLCDQAQESCPVFPGDPKLIHWSFPDPSAATGDENDRYQAFAQVRTELAIRLRTWIQALRSSGADTAAP